MPGASRAGLADAAFRVPGADLPGLPADRVVLVGRFCGGIGIAANFVGKYDFVLLAMFVLLDEIPGGVSVQVLPASVFVARDLGSCPGLATFQNEAELSNRSGPGRHDDDASRVEQRRSALVEPAPVDSELGVVLAGLVSGRDGTASRLQGWMGRQRRPMEWA